MPTFKASKIPTKEASVDDVLCAFCYNFPQYTYAQAKQLPYRRVKIMMRAARKEQALIGVNMLQAASGASGQKQFTSVLSSFMKVINGDE